VASQFEVQLKDFADSLDIKLEIVVKKIVMDLMTDIIVNTPVDQGTLRQSWRVASEKADLSVSDILEEPMPVAQVLAVFAAGVEEVDGTKLVVLSNNLPYATAIEEGHGVNNAPGGMVASKIAHMQSRLAS